MSNKQVNLKLAGNLKIHTLSEATSKLRLQQSTIVPQPTQTGILSRANCLLTPVYIYLQHHMHTKTTHI